MNRMQDKRITSDGSKSPPKIIRGGPEQIFSESALRDALRQTLPMSMYERIVKVNAWEALATIDAEV